MKLVDVIEKMPKEKSEAEKAAGKLISAIQKEWFEELGEPDAKKSEVVMNLAHTLLQACTPSKMRETIRPRSVKQFLGNLWVEGHPSVKPAIENLEKIIAASNDKD